MKTAIITGASGDIGKATAYRLAKDGYALCLIYHNDESAIALCDDLKNDGVFATAYKCDISNEVAVYSTVNKILQNYNHIDLLVNNAAISLCGLITDFNGNDFDRIFGVNVKGIFLMCNAVLPTMINKKSGSIVNISSIWGQVGASCEVLYSATKAAVIGYTKALASEVGLSNIRVNCVAPGYIDTKMNSHISADDTAAFANDTPLGKIGSPQDVANAVAFLCSDEARFITGHTLSVNGGYVM